MKTIIFLLLPSFFNCLFATHPSHWMKDIPGHKLISELTIPGTHNSYAKYGNNAIVAEFAVCQDWTVPQQLEKGVRFFDVRFRPYNNFFTVHHGDVYQKKVGGDVFQDFVTFLSNNPSETVLISIKDETDGNDRIFPYCHGRGGGCLRFTPILKSYLENNKYRPWIYLGDYVMPRLEKARGKMFLINQNTRIPNGWGISKNFLTVKDQWNKIVSHNGNPVWSPLTGLLNGVSDDRSDISRIDSSKLNGIKSNMEKAGKTRKTRDELENLHLTYCTGNDAPRWSNRRIASAINPYVERFIRRKTLSHTFGVVIMDFPSSSIIDSLIQHNSMTSR